MQVSTVKRAYRRIADFHTCRIQPQEGLYSEYSKSVCRRRRRPCGGHRIRDLPRNKRVGPPVCGFDGCKPRTGLLFSLALWDSKFAHTLAVLRFSTWSSVRPQSSPLTPKCATAHRPYLRIRIALCAIAGITHPSLDVETASSHTQRSTHKHPSCGLSGRV